MEWNGARKTFSFPAPYIVEQNFPSCLLAGDANLQKILEISKHLIFSISAGISIGGRVLGGTSLSAYSCRLKSALPVCVGERRASSSLGTHASVCKSPSPRGEKIFALVEATRLVARIGERRCAPTIALGSARFSVHTLPAKAGAPSWCRRTSALPVGCSRYTSTQMEREVAESISGNFSATTRRRRKCGDQRPPGSC